jgi:glutamyl-tRNA reductase
MDDALIACTLEIPEPQTRERWAKHLRTDLKHPMLVLNTCQRLETYGRQRPEGIPEDIEIKCMEEEEAIRYFARIATGLESRILGELEIMGQVRQAYKDFHQKYGKTDARLDRMFQKGIALARRARRESGIDQNLTGLAALTARRIIESVPDTAPVTIVGSGSLAKGVARYLGKRTRMPVRISSRCPENAMRLAIEIGGFSSGLDELIPMLQEADVVVSATSAPHPLIYNHHLPETGRQKLVIDLGEPPDCALEIQQRSDIEYIGLMQMESHANTNTLERQRRAELAAAIIASEQAL